MSTVPQGLTLKGKVIRSGPVVCTCGNVIDRSVARFEPLGKDAFFLIIRPAHSTDSGAECAGPDLNAKEAPRG
ncbi:hypothetical protein [Myxococcus eversor]|uniref:hypothetical protein n=1 Tax=Myxococcus eversor TaxID=2709661 RepID=UPI001966DB3F|nr:hypothetical protein [Myxococcus eversor]